MLGIARKQTRQKALIALAFAGALINPQMPASTEELSESTDSLIQQIQDSTQVAPEDRAYTLLRLADAYLSGKTVSEVESQFRPAGTLKSGKSILTISWERQRLVSSWAEEVCAKGHSTSHAQDGGDGSNSGSRSIDRKNLLLADRAIETAVKQLDKSSDTFAKLTMYLIASGLFQTTGNTDGARKCKEVLQKALESCEQEQPINDGQIRAASLVLNSMANLIIPVYIPDFDPRENPGAQAPVPPFTKEDFKESEKLKRRALALTDRLGPQSDLRRKAHRDLSLWYATLGMSKEAEKEKQTLFDLVGIHDDRILYAQRGMCGHAVWWVMRPVIMGLCGMG